MIRRVLLVACGLALSACVAVVPVPLTVPVAPGASATAPAQSTASFTTRINGFRAENGFAGLRQNAALTSAAQAHAEDMVARGYFSHSSQGGPNGATLIARARSAGCNARAIAENIAQGQQSEAEILTGWANSPGHRRNMLNRSMTDYGLGRAGDIWVLKLSSGC